MINLPILNNKECGTCTKCCEGWLSAKIHDQVLLPNNPCKYIKNNSCSIYDNRPIKPCRTFNCLWISKNLPEEFKPSVSGVISIQNIIEKQSYIFLVNAPKYPSKELVNWFKINYKNNNLLYFSKEDELMVFGEPNFIKTIMNNKESIYQQHNQLKNSYIKD